MSMVYGDSSDLMNEGSGGGIRNFWRSRTSFERKLLVTLMVMVVIIIGLIVAVAVVATQEELSPKYSSYPNSKFVDKHVCTTCLTPNDALTFTKKHRGEPAKNIPLNTVFDGHDILYTIGNYNSEETCTISSPVHTWNCQHVKGIWVRCTFLGSCTGHSTISNGHFFSESLDCP